MGDLGEKAIRFFYVNWRGERSIRVVVPRTLTWGSTEWHPEPQWIMTAYDLDKGDERYFALQDCQFVRPPVETEITHFPASEE